MAEFHIFRAVNEFPTQFPQDYDYFGSVEARHPEHVIDQSSSHSVEWIRHPGERNLTPGKPPIRNGDFIVDPDGDAYRIDPDGFTHFSTTREAWREWNEPPAASRSEVNAEAKSPENMDAIEADKNTYQIWHVNDQVGLHMSRMEDSSYNHGFTRIADVQAGSLQQAAVLAARLRPEPASWDDVIVDPAGMSHRIDLGGFTPVESPTAAEWAGQVKPVAAMEPGPTADQIANVKAQLNVVTRSSFFQDRGFPQQVLSGEHPDGSTMYGELPHESKLGVLLGNVDWSGFSMDQTFTVIDNVTLGKTDHFWTDGIGQQDGKTERPPMPEPPNQQKKRKLTM